MAFVVHHQRPRLLKREISVSGNYVITIGAVIAAEHNIRASSYIQLSYNPDTAEIGLRVFSAYTPGAGKISGYGSGLHVSARAFCRLNNIVPGRYAAQFDQQSGMIVCTPSPEQVV